GLLPAMAAHLQPGAQLLYLSGEDIAHDASALLTGQGVTVTRMVAYEAVPTSALTPELRQALMDGAVSQVMFFSARSATLACGLLKEEEFTQAPSAIDAYCLSLSVAEAA